MKGRLDHVGVIVADIVAARRLLEEVIGLELKREHHSTEARLDAAFLGFDSGPDSGALVEVVELGDPAARSRRLGPDAVARIEHIAIEVDDYGRSFALEGSRCSPTARASQERPAAISPGPRRPAGSISSSSTDARRWEGPRSHDCAQVKTGSTPRGIGAARRTCRPTLR